MNYLLITLLHNIFVLYLIQKFPIILRNLQKCPECLQRFHVEWQGKSSRKGISLILNRLIPR
jgi:hypothetical protein